jgi:hypothetical protein
MGRHCRGAENAALPEANLIFIVRGGGDRMKILERILGAGRNDQKRTGLGRNDLCWCGSGKKYKRCHLEKDENDRRKKSGTA